jgi:hypothetical protein
MIQAPASPAGTFAQHLETGAAAAVVPGKVFRLALAFNGTPVGHLGIDDGGWCRIDPDGVPLEWYADGDGKTYLKVAAGAWDDGYYLSTSKNAHVGVYNWARANAWRLDAAGRLTDLDSKQPLSFYASNNPTLYAWDEYNVLAVTQG